MADKRDQLYQFQEGHYIWGSNIQAGTTIPEIIYHFDSGRYFVTAMQNLDYTLVMGLTIFFGAFLIGMNFLVDLAYGLIDPRIRTS